MRGPWRAALAVALHIGFLAVPAALVLGMVGITAYTIRYDLGDGLQAAFAALLVGGSVAMVLRGVLRAGPRPPLGVVVEGEAQPQLWRRLRKVAEAAEATSPDELRVTCEPTLRMRERTRLLGLLRGESHLELGLPLLAGLTVSELSAVLADEIGSGQGGGPDALAVRIRNAVIEAERDMVGGPTKWLFSGYAVLYKRFTAPLARGRVMRGDAVAVRLAGKRTTMAALRKRVGLELGWEDYSAEYLSMATRVGRTPEILPGFRAFLEHPERKQGLAERAKESIATEKPADAARPTVAQRLDVLKRASHEPDETDDRPALALIREPRRDIPAIEDRLLVEDLGERTPWPELARLAGRHDVAVKAGELSSAVEQSGVSTEPTLVGVLTAIHRGETADLINPALNPGLAPELVDEAVVDTMTELLGAAVVDALVRSERAHHELDWGGPSTVQLTDGRALDPDKLVRPAVLDPRLVPGLHRHLVHLGVPLDHAQPAAEEPEPKLSGIVSPVRYAEESYDLLVTDRGLLLLPDRTRWMYRLLAGALTPVRRSEHERLDRLAATPMHRLRELEGAQWLDSRDVATAELHEDGADWELTLDLYLDEYAVSEVSARAAESGESDSPDDEGLTRIRIRSIPDSGARGAPYSGLGELMGARMTTAENNHQFE
ncbi:hypothetical protein SAMN04487820_108144 [Actinopolyspora mzabensis]|uniref:Zn-dependent protease with chaperone function n=1 Tax=Actinopolyspora mzabensis TaxID=995066 RepID=A0A1G9C6I2_ACTMZ|nr:M48 family metallopeptidase [Actinopolyspora mzabensis]SDK47260.1 hypothetical protein SAMN04487820_108144 [Actinopolyspora mzabensis]